MARATVERTCGRLARPVCSALTGAVLTLVWIGTAFTCQSGEKINENGSPAVKPVARPGDRPEQLDPPQRAVNYTELARNLVRYPHNPVIKVGEKGMWDDQTLGCFTVLDNRDTFFFYSGGTQHGKPKKIGMATSKDGIHWTKFAGNPLFPGSMPYRRFFHPACNGDGVTAYISDFGCRVVIRLP